MAMTLFPHQEADVRFLVHSSDGALLGSDMGLGKSGGMASALRALGELGEEALPALIISPNSVKAPWAAQIETWLPGATPYVLSSSNKTKELKKVVNDPTAIVLINYELARTLSRIAPFGSIRLKRCPACGGGDETVTETKCQVHAKPLNAIPFKTVIADEAHRMKDPHAVQTRACWALSHMPSVEHRFAMTGTPIANHIGDLWSIGHFMAPAEYPTMSKFLDRYALRSWNTWGGMDIVGINPATSAEFFGFFDARFRRVTKAQADLGLPPKLRTIRTSTMPTIMRKAYDELEQTLITRLPSGEIVFTPSGMVQSLRLMQLSSSFIEVNEAGDIRLVDKPASPKLDVLMEVLDELGDRQVAVCAVSKQLIDLAANRLDEAHISYGIITGGVSTPDRDRYLEEFQAGKRRVMLFTVQAGGTGLTMTAADTLVFLQRDWSIINNKQAEDRIHRIGSEIHESVNIVDIIAPDTVEVRQVERLHEKLELLNQVTRDADMFDASYVDDLRSAPL